MASGKRVGYVRVSTVDQNTDRQLDGIEVDVTFTEKVSGKDTARPELERMLQYVREDDTVIVHSIDRLARNLQDLLGLVKGLVARGVTVQFVKENLIFGGTAASLATNELMLSMLGAVAQFERSMILERQREGIAIAKAAGKYKGRTPSLTEAQAVEARELFGKGVPAAKLARKYGVSRPTIYKAVGQTATM